MNKILLITAILLFAIAASSDGQPVLREGYGTVGVEVLKMLDLFEMFEVPETPIPTGNMMLWNNGDAMLWNNSDTMQWDA